MQTLQEKFMSAAIAQAKLGEKYDEVPVGAVIVRDGKIIARGRNHKEEKGCANFHAEMVAIEKACKKLGDWRLNECEMYVTLEPCPMCAGAIINARVGKVFFGAFDQKAGCCGSVYNLGANNEFNHKPEVLGGILQDECATLLSEYFKKKRTKKC
ncbi:MAG: nucleoside deaminase [Clostridia bacterium]